MRDVIRVGQPDVPAFLAYCRAHRFDHDESFLDEHSLSLFVPGQEEKAVILRDEAGAVRGAASLMLGPSQREMHRARFRVFHAEAGGESEYRAMFGALFPVEADFRECCLFLPGKAEAAARVVQGLGFRVDRRSWLLARSLRGPVAEPSLAGISLVPLDPSDSGLVRAWCDVINDAFHGMAGHSTMTPASLAALLDPAAEFSGGNLIAFDAQHAVGLVAVKKDTDEASGTQAYLGPVAVIRERQKKGLGRALLCAGLSAAKARGFASCVLTVNAENEKALGLYVAEGFERRAVYTCWARPCP
jgi:mycothiol synthase